MHVKVLLIRGGRRSLRLGERVVWSGRGRRVGSSRFTQPFVLVVSRSLEDSLQMLNVLDGCFEGFLFGQLLVLVFIPLA